ncbi:MAG: diguanylate cyclase [Deltaproteobacteria bacterium]|nr:diguanylate cyclase [Deltaproteobacteria bacterium]
MNRGTSLPGTSRPPRRYFVVVAAAVSVLLIGALDYATGPGISLILFYLIPIAVVAWFEGLVPGITISVFAILLLFLTRPLAAGIAEWERFHYWNVFMRFGVFVVVAYMVSMQAAIRRLLRREKELARRDILTGAVNLREFTELLSAEILRLSRYGRHFSLAYIDLDNFKSVNDRRGHASGDRLLRIVADGLRNAVRSSDVVARIGGDEFAILLPETGAVSAVAVIRKVQGTVDDFLREGLWDVTMSIGLLTCESPPESSDQALRLADSLMYRAKSEGKNRVCNEVA